ncbi:hypothetical protein PENSPDRAFT_37253 [Peniophora sp. CONT]|nr:hypothetical protein PENSPDRAFT_37253 [Peniophora sp. CONT]
MWECARGQVRAQLACLQPPSSSTMDDLDAQQLVNEAASLAKQLRETIETLPPQMFGGDLSREIVLEACDRVQNLEPAVCRVDLPSDFVPVSYLPRIVVGVLGLTGAGKSTFLNCLLGKNILNTSGNKRGTSFPTIIVYHDKSSIDAAITYMSKDDFCKHVDAAIDLVQLDDEGKELSLSALRSHHSFSLLEEALEIKRRYLYETGTTSQKVLLDYPEIQELLGKTQYVSKADEQKFMNQANTKLRRRTGHAHYRPWPLITGMIIKCKAPALKDGTIVVDMPGSFDISATVLHATEVFKDKLDFTLAAAHVNRSQNDATLNGLMDNEVARQLRMQVANVSCDSNGQRELTAGDTVAAGLAAIVTQCDATGTNVRWQVLETDSDIGGLLNDDEYYSELVEHYEDLTSQISEVKEKQREIKNDLESAVEHVHDSPSGFLQYLKRYQPDHPEDLSAAKRQKVEAEGGSSAVKLKPSSSGVAADAEDALNTLSVSLEKLVRELETCKRKRQVYVSAMRSQVVCREIRRQYMDKMSSASNKEELSPLPVFATSAVDFADLEENPGNVDLNTDVERTGMPAVRAFVRNLGARQQRLAALNIIQPFLAQVVSVSNLLGAVEDQHVGIATQEKLALMARWSSPSHSERSGAEAGAGGSAQPEQKTMTLQATLKAVFDIALKSEMDDVRQKLADLESACLEPLTELISEHIPDVVEDILSFNNRFWCTWRDTLRHGGVRGEVNWNTRLARPLVASTTQPQLDLIKHWKDSALPGLQFKVLQVAVNVFNQVKQALGKIHENNRKIAEIVTKDVLDTDERDTRPRTLADAVQTSLKPMYDAACDIGGRGSTVAQKELFKRTLKEQAATMYQKIVHEFIKARRDVVDKVEEKLSDTLNQTAKEVEYMLSQAWSVAGYNAEEVATRTSASEVANNVRGRLAEMELALRDAMEHAEKDVPSCYPPQTIPDFDDE